MPCASRNGIYARSDTISIALPLTGRCCSCSQIIILELISEVTGPVSDMCSIPGKTSPCGLKSDVVDQDRPHMVLNSHSKGVVRLRFGGFAFLLTCCHV